MIFKVKKFKIFSGELYLILISIVTFIVFVLKLFKNNTPEQLNKKKKPIFLIKKKYLSKFQSKIFNTFSIPRNGLDHGCFFEIKTSKET